MDQKSDDLDSDVQPEGSLRAFPKNWPDLSKVLFFRPLPVFSRAFLQTILGSQMFSKVELPDRVLHKVSLGGRSSLICHEVPPDESQKSVVLLMHGMGGCSESAYMRRIALKLHQSGFGIFMMNHRGSGAGMGMSDRLWNGGSSEDLGAVIDHIVSVYPLKKLYVVGFSLSGNVLLKYLGEKRRIPRNLLSALAVNPPIDLKVASDRITNGPGAAIYNKYYLKLIHQQIEAIQDCFPDAFIPGERAKTILEFDTLYTAPAGGFETVDDYYEKSSSNRYLESIKVPVTLLCSQDDPFIPKEVFENLRKSICVELVRPERGGHMGYLSGTKLGTGDRRWMDQFVTEWVKESASTF